MILNVHIDEQTLSLDIPADIVEQATEVFDKMDLDMDKGWQMGRHWLEHPDREQRCRIVADRLLSAIESGNESLGTMMAAYILNRAPDVNAVRIDTSGEIEATELQRG